MTSLPQQTFTYDGENRLTASAQQGTPAIGYVYDGDGKRVQKTVGAAVTTYVYDASGELVAEYGAPTDTGTTYVSTDHLGSTRLLQRSAGSLQHYDYLPFGEDLPSGVGGRDSTYASGMYPASGPDFVPIKFTGKERDWETGLDFFQARYYSAWQGRFGEVDPANAGADSSSPQSFHGYAYVSNNPLVYTDPNGRKQEFQGDLYSGGSVITVDGIDQITKGNIGGNGMVACPGNVCSGWMADGKGQIAYSQFFAGADGSRGWQAVGPWVADPAEPSNQIYKAFQLAAQYAQTAIDPGALMQVLVRYVGTTYNVQIPHNELNAEEAAKDGYKDPLTFMHNGATSYYMGLVNLIGIDAGHVVAADGGVEAHYDSFGPYNPLHELLEALPSLFINTRGSAVAVPYTCSMNGGCHK